MPESTAISSRQRGQATAEYLVVSFALIVALFVPVEGDKSAIVLLMDAIRTFYVNTSYVVSLP